MTADPSSEKPATNVFATRSPVVAARLPVVAARLPVVAAPMAGGVTTPELVIEAGKAGALGFLPLGYWPVEQFEENLQKVREADVPFGVNLFVPQPAIEGDASREARDEVAKYAQQLSPHFSQFGVEAPDVDVLPGLTEETAEQELARFNTVIDLLARDPVPLVSFTFGAPEKSVVERLQAVGTTVLLTVTNAEEAKASEDLGADALVVQGSAAGGHSAIWNVDDEVVARPTVETVLEVKERVSLPVIAAGGVSSPEDVKALLDAGATAVAVGTLLMRSDEAGTSKILRDTLDNKDGTTTLTRAFTGRLARSLTNSFTIDCGRYAPSRYPAVHYLTAPLRAAATKADDPAWVNLWAGEGFKHAPEGPAGEILRWLADT